MVKTKKTYYHSRNKRKQKLHHQNLKLYLSLGLQLNKIHRILEFKQEPSLKSYIESAIQICEEKQKKKVKKSKSKMLN